MVKKMKSKRTFIAIALIAAVGIIVFGIYQTQKDPPLTADAHIAKRYLENRGYKVQAYKGDYHYVLNRKKLNEPDIKEEWKVQKTDPDPFFGKTIEEEFFVVTNHPLNQLGYKLVHVSVYMVNGNVVGGTSFPYAPNQGLMGSTYSLDGKTLEQLQGIK